MNSDIINILFVDFVYSCVIDDLTKKKYSIKEKGKDVLRKFGD